MSSNSTPFRAKTSCWPCRQRKVRCSKSPLPCTNCVRRGEQSACAVEFETVSRPVPQQTVPTSRPSPDHELIYLRRKVVELEAEVRHYKSPSTASSTIVENDPARATAASEPSPVLDEDDAQSKSSGTLIVEDAASILEFLAWGRQKNLDYHRLASPELVRTVPSADIQEQPDALDEDSLDSLQMLLPSQRQVWELIEYSDNSLLWFHGSYMPSQFRAELHTFYDEYQGGIKDSRLDLQWVALLFSILTSSLVCAPRLQTMRWGFRPHEQAFLGKKWSSAVMTFLNKAAYTANHSIYSVQAISTLTMSAHLLGHSNMQSIHLAAAVRIAQALGLHQLTTEKNGTDRLTTELGRRIWQQLCSQDWFNIPFSETYLINPLYSRSEPPMNCHDDGFFVPLPEEAPTRESYCRFLAKIATLMPHLLDDIASCNTPYTKYHRVLSWDNQLRALASDRPPMLSNQPIQPEWPAYTEWARRALAISSSHKIIMVHRSFLSESFTNPTFDFTRRTCIAASKTIIKEFKIAVADAGMPTFWTYQAFAVAASIILLLDTFHRHPRDRESIEHTKLARETTILLRGCQNSMIASRGVKLLSALLEDNIKWQAHDTSSRVSSPNSKKRSRESDPSSLLYDHPPKRGPSFNIAAFIEAFHQSKSSPAAALDDAGSLLRPHPAQSSSNKSHAPDRFDLMGASFIPGPLKTYDSRQASLITTYQANVPVAAQTNCFDNLLYLASHDFSII